MAFFCGFDFGTSNTVVTILAEGTDGQKIFSDSSVLFLPDCGPLAQRRYVGQEAIDEYVNHGMDGRFIQSIKSVLPDPAFTQTLIYGKTYTPEDLVAMILNHFKSRVEEFIGGSVTGAVFGRPVKFSELETNDALAESRLREAASRCGFDHVEFIYEPVAAATRYRSGLEAGSCSIVCDLGGGTADFSVILIDDDGNMVIPASHGVRIGGDDVLLVVVLHDCSAADGLDNSGCGVGRGPEGSARTGVGTGAGRDDGRMDEGRSCSGAGRVGYDNGQSERVSRLHVSAAVQEDR